TRLIRISSRSTDLRKGTVVNAISRRISQGELSPTEAYQELEALSTDKRRYPAWLQALAAAIASGCFLIMFQGLWSDFFPAFLAGGLGTISITIIHRVVPIK